MKKLVFIITLVLSVTLSQAQENVIKVNPLGIVFGIANAGYEFSINETQSLTIGALYYNNSGIDGIGGGLEYRFYFDEVLQRWHAGPTVGYFSLKDDFDNSAGVFNIGVEGGHQWIIGEHFVVDVFANLSYVIGESDVLNFNATTIGIGVSLGYAW